LAADSNERTFITNEYTNRLVHKWRSEEAAIMVGSNTALKDNPTLSTRLWKGNSPVRVVLDMRLRLPQNLQLLDGSIKTIVFNGINQEKHDKLWYHKLDKDGEILQQVCAALYSMDVQSVLVEGGPNLLQSFIDKGLYDEIIVVENTALHIGDGLFAPQFPKMVLQQKFRLVDDEVSMYCHHL